MYPQQALKPTQKRKNYYIDDLLKPFCAKIPSLPNFENMWDIIWKMALTDHPVLLCTFCCVVVWFPCTEGCCSWIFWDKLISTKQRDVTLMEVKEDLVELFWHLLVHVEGWSGVAVLKVVSKLCQHWVCRSRKEHRFGNIWKRNDFHALVSVFLNNINIKV